MTASALNSQLSHFDNLFTFDEDPWNVRVSHAERHKRRAVDRMIGSQRLGWGLELGTGNGVTTRALAPRFAHLVAIDGSPAAVELTRRETRAHDNVEVLLRVLPCALPVGAFDVVVASEVLYYLPAPALTAMLANIYAALKPNGHFISTHHWRCFTDAQSSPARLADLSRRRFGAPSRTISGSGWRCDNFARRVKPAPQKCHSNAHATAAILRWKQAMSMPA